MRRRPFISFSCPNHRWRRRRGNNRDYPDEEKEEEEEEEEEKQEKVEEEEEEEEEKEEEKEKEKEAAEGAKVIQRSKDRRNSQNRSFSCSTRGQSHSGYDVLLQLNKTGLPLTF